MGLEYWRLVKIVVRYFFSLGVSLSILCCKMPLEMIGVNIKRAAGREGHASGKKAKVVAGKQALAFCGPNDAHKTEA